MAYVGVIHLQEVGGSEIPTTFPKVTSALATSDYTVQVTFDQKMKATNPTNANDVLNHSNYNFTSLIGVARIPSTAIPITLVQASPTIVEMTLDGEMTNGVNYDVEVSNVENTVGMEVDTDFDTASFTGSGTRPELDSAVAVDAYHVDLDFNEAMKNDANLVDTSHYVIAAPGPNPNPASVTVLSPTRVRLELPWDLLDGNACIIHGNSAIDDIANNSLVPAIGATFTAIGIAPELDVAGAVDPITVELTFSETVEQVSAETVGNYAVTAPGGGALTVHNAVKVTDTQVRLTVDAQSSGILYTVEATGVTDIGTNPCVAPNNTATFTGVGISPPFIECYPSDGDDDVPIRTMVRVDIKDDPENFSGIAEATVWIRVTYVNVYGSTVTEYAVNGGTLQTDFFEVTKEGSGTATDGLIYRFRPKTGKWPEVKMLTVEVYAEDTYTASNAQTFQFETAGASCFEDAIPDSMTDIETMLVTAIASSTLSHLEELRKFMLEKISTKGDAHVRTRTLLHLAGMTDLRATLAGVIDLALTESRMCDRNPTMTIYNAVLRKRLLILAALREIGVSDQLADLLRKYIDSKSPVYVVNAAALVVVLGVAGVD